VLGHNSRARSVCSTSRFIGFDAKNSFMNKRLQFYKHTLSHWVPDRQASILVVAGGSNDQDILNQLGFINVVMSNLSSEMNSSDLFPFKWSRQDVEGLTYGDGAFDYVVVHAGLHHCRSPHRGLLEMYRVASKAVIAFEPADNILVRFMMRMGMAQTYENAVVCSNNGKGGGVNSTTIPNFVFRFTAREVEKTIHSFAPVAHHRINYAYGYDEPAMDVIGKRGGKRVLVGMLMPLYRLFLICFPKQGNLFAFRIEKPDLSKGLLPWLILKDGVPQAKS
jgi:SAM-dependent methyltransferase